MKLTQKDLPESIRTTKTGLISVYDFLEFYDNRKPSYSRILIAELKRYYPELMELKLTQDSVKTVQGQWRQTPAASLENCQIISDLTRRDKGQVGDPRYIKATEIEQIKDLFSPDSQVQIRLSGDNLLNIYDLVLHFTGKPRSQCKTVWELALHNLHKISQERHDALQKVIEFRHFPGSRNTTYEPPAIALEYVREVAETIISYKQYLDTKEKEKDIRQYNVSPKKRINPKTYSDRGRVGVDYGKTLETKLNVLAQTQNMTLSAVARTMLVKGLRAENHTVLSNQIPINIKAYTPLTKIKGERSLDLGGIKPIVLNLSIEREESISATIRYFINVALSL